MPSTILSDNGVSSGSAGLKTTAASDGALVLQTTTSGGTATNAVYIDTAQNVGLGVTPSAWSTSGNIQLVASSGDRAISSSSQYVGLAANAYYNASWKYITSSQAATLFAQEAGSYKWYNAPSGTAGNSITLTQAMTLDTSGNLGIGTTSPTSRLTLSGSAGVGATTLASTGTTTGYNAFAITNNGNTAYFAVDNVSGTAFSGSTAYATVIGGNAAYNLHFITNGTVRSTIDSSGNLLVGKTTTALGTVGSYLSAAGGWFCSGVNGTNFYHVYDTTNSVFRFYVAGAGQVYATNTSIIAISDVSLKENIRDLETGLNEVMALKPRRFDWKNGDATNVAGFIAQELEEVMPDLVYESMYTEEETKKSIKMGDILPTLVKAIQELKAEFDAYKATHP